MSLNNLEIVSEILHNNQGKIIFQDTGFFGTDNLGELQNSLTKANIIFDTIGDRVSIKLKRFINPNLVYFDEIRTKFESKFIKEEFSILNTVGEYCFKSADANELIFSDNVSKSFQTTCTNLFFYYKLYDFLKSKPFVDHHNDANTEIVLYSSTKGIFKIKYNPVPALNFNEDISRKVDQIIQTASPQQIRLFFKNSLFTFSNNPGEIIIDEIIIRANEIISETNRDFELFSKQFDFNNFRDSLYKEKEKYFNSIREIINKIFSQAVGIPISISAAVFATYKVSDDPLMLLLVMLSFIFYVAFYVKIQLTYKLDIYEIKNDFNSDFDTIKSMSGLSEEIIDKEKDKIDRKISSSISVVNYLIGFVIFLGFLVCLYILYEIAISETICFLRSLFRI